VVTVAGAVLLAVGVAGWSVANQRWQLFAAALLSGAGWVTMGAAAVNAIISPWFVVARPAALSIAYNGASVGGIVFSPLWVTLVASRGFAEAAVIVGVFMVLTVVALSILAFSKSPDVLGQFPDGAQSDQVVPLPVSSPSAPLRGASLWRDRRFLTLATGMAAGLFAQIGLLAHLFSIIVPIFGSKAAGLLMGGATVAAIVGRTSIGWLMPVWADRRLVASTSYGVQIVGSLMLLGTGGESVVVIGMGVMLFGLGIGNATSLPPLIAQVEFCKEDVVRVVPLIVSLSQGTYALAPALFGIMRGVSDPAVFIIAAAIQCLAIMALLFGRASGP
jgi:Major Facilitator Superfamily